MTIKVSFLDKGNIDSHNVINLISGQKQLLCGYFWDVVSIFFIYFILKKMSKTTFAQYPNTLNLIEYLTAYEYWMLIQLPFPFNCTFSSLILWCPFPYIFYRIIKCVENVEFKKKQKTALDLNPGLCGLLDLN